MVGTKHLTHPSSLHQLSKAFRFDGARADEVVQVPNFRFYGAHRLRMLQTANMPTENILLISGPQDFMGRFEAESLGLSLCNEASRRGGDGWAGWLEPGVLKVRIHGMSLDEIRSLMNAYFESAQKHGRSISIIEQQADATPLPNVIAGEIPWGTVIRQKLTKKLLKILPEGAYLVSNSYSEGEEIFSERLGAPETRETTWRRALISGANNRLCRLVWKEVDFNGPDLPPQDVQGPAR